MSTTNIEQINEIVREWEAKTTAELSSLCDQYPGSSDKARQAILSMPAALAYDLKKYVEAKLNISGGVQ